ncbi:MAG: hypothetical protein JO247_14100, partial [Chloroflexi bacterium]|nr:hypothetical protein [Chloroflexota bacterium]
MLVGSRAQNGWWVTVERGIISRVGPEPPATATCVDMGDMDLIPGLIDLHSDCLELKAHPRPSTELPLTAALFDLDTEAVAHGITTHFTCVSLEDDAVKYRSLDRARQMVDCIASLRDSLRSDLRVHLRVDVTGSGTGVAAQLAASGVVSLMSYMDHTPGQGQYADEADWRRYYMSVVGSHEEELDQRLQLKRAGQAHADERRAEVAHIAHENGAALASHDDDSLEAVQRAQRFGARISEFP